METTMTRPKYRLVDGIVGGLLAGVVMAAIVMLGSILTGRSALYPVALMGHAFSPYTDNPSMSNEVIMRGLAMHFGLCMAGGLVFSAIASMFPLARNLWIWGVLYGAALWGIARLVTPQLNPTMDTQFNTVVMLVGYVVYGGVLGGYVEARMRGFRRGKTDDYREDAVRRERFVRSNTIVRNPELDRRETVIHDEHIGRKSKVIHDEEHAHNDENVHIDINVRKDRKVRDKVPVDTEVHTDEYEPV